MRPSAIFLGRGIRVPVNWIVATMFDLAYIALGLGVFAVFTWYAFACDRL